MKLEEILTIRQLEIATLIADGLQSSAIAEKLRIGRRTVESHRKVIKQRLELQLAKEAAELAGVATTSNQKALHMKVGPAVIVHFLVAKGHVKPKFQPTQNEPGLHSILGQQEYNVLLLLAAGYTNKEICDELVSRINVRTVETHRAHIYEKLKKSYEVTSASVAGLTHFALARKLLPLKFTPSRERVAVDLSPEVS
jgi:DNA-binding NarL/FixJ family response regulator